MDSNAAPAMPVCRTCGREMGEDFSFCPACGSAVAPAPTHEQRKRVTVLFCDITGSTELGETVDPETLRAVLARYFDHMKTIVETHGGTVEKFIGDAVMAIFGVPLLHEDDALRAARAGLEMQAALPELGVKARIGIHSGEVVTGTEERLATGDAVNIAARLEQAAQPGEVLIGEETFRLVRDAVRVEALEPLQLKGKRERVKAFRLTAIREPEERADRAPMIGRERELDRLRLVFEQAAKDSSCQLFTILGAAGVGKSRLIREFLIEAGRAHVVQGQCLPYGHGITYWPVVEILEQLPGRPADEYANTVLRSLQGEVNAPTSADEIAWAFRKVLEEQARSQPLVAVFGDIHWAEENLLDLIESVADLARDAPMLLLCTARPELLEKRPSWGGGKWNTTTVLLEPLDARETDELLMALGANDSAVQQRIRAASEGNPLFVEEMLALLNDAGGQETVVPPTIQALMAARLDQLLPDERQVLECGSVEGRVFHQGAVRALADENGNLQGRLRALVRKELVRPASSQLGDDEAFRFRHILIRDAAYDGLPKAVRATLHERFAEWLEINGKALMERDEIVGHHLEQAAGYKRELGRPDRDLELRAGERLGLAGKHAIWRGDSHAAKGLLAHALNLLRPVRLDMYLELGMADLQPTEAEALAVVEAATERAQKLNDLAAEALGRAEAARRHVIMGTGTVDDVETLAREAITLLEAKGDNEGLSHAWTVLGFASSYRGSWEQLTQAGERAHHHARLAGIPGGEAQMGLIFGPRPAEEILHIFDRLIEQQPHPHARLEQAEVLAMLGRFPEAWAVADEASRQMLERTGDEAGEEQMASVALLAGDYEGAATYMRTVCDRLQNRKQSAILSSYAPFLSLLLCDLGRYEEAEPWAKLGQDLAEENDALTQSLWRQARARILAWRQAQEEAERLAREAVTAAEQTDGLNLQGDSLCNLAEVLLAAGRTDEASAVFEEAAGRYQQKGNVTMVARVSARLRTRSTAGGR